MNEQVIKAAKDEVICRAGDLSRDLYKIISGRLLICARKNSMVTPLAYLEADDYFGEFSFFDNQARSADVVAMEETIFVKIPQAELKKQMPFWLIQTCRSLTSKLRTYNDVIRSRGIKRRNADSISPLSIEEQRHYYQLLHKGAN